MGDITLRRLLTIPCEILLRDHLSSTMIIAILGGNIGIVDGLLVQSDSCGSLHALFPVLLISLEI